MKTIIMRKPGKSHRIAFAMTFFLVGSFLFSCSTGPFRRVVPQTSPGTSTAPGPVPEKDVSGHKPTSVSSLPESDVADEWIELSWDGDGSLDTLMKEETGAGTGGFDQGQDAPTTAPGETGKGEEGPSQEDLQIDVKNEQPSNETKEEESSDQARLYDAIDFCQKAQDLWKKGKLEEAKKSLDQAYQSILEVKPNGDAEIMQQIDDLRFLISKRIIEIYASRFNSVKGNHNEIPLVMNDHVRKAIKRFQNKERDFFVESYARSGRYRPLIMEKLEDAGLPLELSWLPLIESGFKVRALSRSRALGLWQFIPSTGYKFGLKRNQWIDERMDVEKSTNAAILYLKELHEIFGDWTTVLAAYNCGEGTVLRWIRRQRINYLDDFWDLYEKLPRETARYVPRFLAVLHIIKDPEGYEFRLDGIDPPLTYEDVRITKRARLKDVARQLGVSERMLIELNPELRFRATPDGYSLKVPPGKARVLLANLESIPQYNPPRQQYVNHRVRHGETLSQIARKYRTTVRAIANTNGIVQKDFIRVGQKLKIPVR